MALPIGTILPWPNRAETPPPAGWHVCDGAEGTLDLRGLWIPAATYDMSNTGEGEYLLLYAENAGAPTEWNWGTAGAGIVVNSASLPYSGAVCMLADSMADGAYAQGEAGVGGVTLSTYEHLVFFCRPTAEWVAGRTLQLRWQYEGSPVGGVVTLASGLYGFNSAYPAWQRVVIPLDDFAAASGVNQLRIADAGGAIGFRIDEVSLQTGAMGSGTPPALTGYYVGQRGGTLPLYWQLHSHGNAGLTLLDVSSHNHASLVRTETIAAPTEMALYYRLGIAYLAPPDHGHVDKAFANINAAPLGEHRHGLSGQFATASPLAAAQGPLSVYVQFIQRIF